MSSSGTINFPAAWGQLTVTVTSSSTTFDASGSPLQKIIHADAIDATGVIRGRVNVLYTYATGVVSTMNGVTTLATATGPQQTTATNAAALDVSIMTAAIGAAAANIIVT